MRLQSVTQSASMSRLADSYRYVMPGPSLKSLAPPPASALSNLPAAEIKQDAFPRPEAVVLIGIFPAAAVAVRPGGVDENPALQAAYEEAVRVAQEAQSASGVIANGYDGKAEMEAVQEEDEDIISSPPAAVVAAGEYVSIPRTPSPSSRKRKSSGGSESTYDKTGDTPGMIDGLLHMHAREDSGGSLRTPAGRTERNGRPTSLVLNKAGPSRRKEAGRQKEEAPLPRLTAGDSTVAGQTMPIVDEIACAVREWYAVSH